MRRIAAVVALAIFPAGSLAMAADPPAISMLAEARGRVVRNSEGTMVELNGGGLLVIAGEDPHLELPRVRSCGDRDAAVPVIRLVVVEMSMRVEIEMGM